jgi:hypothetical protein
VFGNILFAYAVSRSNGVNSAGHVAQSYNGLLIEQNAIAPNGRGIYVGGYVAATGVPSSVLPYAPMQANDAWQNGIDFGGATFTNFAFRSPGFAVDSVGNLSANNVLSTAGHVGSHSAYNPTVGCYDTGQAAGAGLLLGGGSLLYIASLNAAGDYVGTRCTIDTSGNVNATGGVGVFGHTAPVSRPTVSGAKGSNAALASLLTALAAYGLVTDSTTA